MKKIYLACDHAAFNEKNEILKYLSDKFEVVDLGTNNAESVNYPDFGRKLAIEVLKNEAIGIALCGSGIGISIAVNRHKGIRGALCRDKEDAKMCKLHNNANILCLGARRNSLSELLAMVDVWLETEFEGGRHETRTKLLDN